MTFRTMMATAAALTLLGLMPASAADAALTAKVAGAQRSADNKARDAARRPAETLEFWGVKPGQTVIEISPGGGYWSEILAPYAKDTKGHYIAATGRPDQKLPAKFEDAATYGPIHYALFNKGPAELGAPGSAI